MEYGEQVQLLLSAPGHPPVSLPPSPWRAWIWSERGPLDLITAAQAVRLSPVAPRAERALVAAVQADDVDTLGRLAAASGPAQDAARVLAALRLATLDPHGAIDLLTAAVVNVPSDVTANKILRRHWSAMAVHVALAPSVPALFGIGRTSLAVLLAELLADAGRTGESLAVLESLPPSPPVVLSKAAALLALGEHDQVLAATATLPNVDDVAALGLVARSVAARSERNLDTALTAVCTALDIAERSPAVIAAALEERAHLYTMAGDAVAARTDLEALAEMATGRTDVPIPMPATLKHADEDGLDDDSLDRARDRIRRRITGVGAPGTFGGRHHSTYRDEIATMFAHGQIAAVEELLLGLLDAVEDEVDELNVPLDATFFLTLADLYQDNGRTDDLVALRERYAAADARARRSSDAAAADAEGAAPAPIGPSLAKTPVPEPAPAVTVAPAAQLGPEAVVDNGVAPAEPRVVVDPAPAGEERSPDAAPALSPVAEERLADVLSGPAPDDASELTEPDMPDEEPADEDDVFLVEASSEPAPEAKPERELTPVERAVRGPRVRSL